MKTDTTQDQSLGVIVRWLDSKGQTRKTRTFQSLQSAERFFGQILRLGQPFETNEGPAEWDPVQPLDETPFPW